MNRFLGVACCFLLGMVGMCGAEEFSGSVVDSSGKGMADITVSDGRNVVATDSEGKFRLAGWDRAKFVFVTTPAGFRCTENFYLPVRSETKSYDFRLEPYPISAGDEVRIAQVTDVETSELNGWISDLQRCAKTQGCAFVISTGDLCRRNGIEFNAKNVNTKTIGVPTYTCIGNHDFVRDLPTGEQFYEEHFGPCWYSMDAGPVHFVVTPMRGGDARASFSANDFMQWVKADAARVPKEKVICHINHATWGGEKFEDPSNYQQGTGAAAVDLHVLGAKAFLSGHRHNNIVYKDKSGMVFAIGAPGDKGGNDHSPANILLYTFDRNGIRSVDTRETYVNHQVVLISPKDGLKPGARIMVQAYDTAADVRSARWILADSDGKELHSGSLKQAFDWTWKGKLSKKVKTIPKAAKLRVEVEFTDGEKRQAEYAPPEKAILKEQWTVNVGGNLHFSPILADKTGLYLATGSDHEPEKNRILRLNKTGKILWESPVKNAIKSPISLEKGTVFASDIAWNVYALNAKNGKSKWDMSLGGARTYGLLCAPVVHKGVVYAGMKDDLYALNANTGKVLWKNTAWTGGIVTNAPHAVVGDKLVVSSNWGPMYAHDLKTGNLLWKTTGDRMYRGSAVLELPGGKQDDRKILLSSHCTLVVVDMKDGKILQSVGTGPSLQTTSAPILVDNTVLAGTATDGLAAFDSKTLKRLWKFQPGENLFYTSPYTAPKGATVEATPVKMGPYVVLGALDGFLYVLQVSEKSAEVVQKINLGAPILAPVTVVGKTVYATDFSGNVHAFQWNR